MDKFDILTGRRIAFTTPAIYASRLEELLRSYGASTLWCPSVLVGATPATRKAVSDCLSADSPFPFASFSGIAFTSRSGIHALIEADQLSLKALELRDRDERFFVAALGRDAELLQEWNLFRVNKQGIKLIVPSRATPQALVEQLGEGHGKRILCPVPAVEGLEEPRVVPDFLNALSDNGWQVKRINAYVTRWAGPDCAAPLMSDLPQLPTQLPSSSSVPLPLYSALPLLLPWMGSSSSSSSLSQTALQTLAMSKGAPMGKVDALIFTSTAEVEGLLRSFRALGIAPFTTAGRPVLAAHGPVTAAGAARLGVKVDVVSKRFESFEGIMEALALHWKPWK